MKRLLFCLLFMLLCSAAQAADPVPPSDFAIDDSTTTTLSVSFTNVDVTVDSLALYRITAAGDTVGVAYFAPTDTAVDTTITGIAPGTSYTLLAKVCINSSYEYSNADTTKTFYPLVEPPFPACITQMYGKVETASSYWPTGDNTWTITSAGTADTDTTGVFDIGFRTDSSILFNIYNANDSTKVVVYLEQGEYPDPRKNNNGDFYWVAVDSVNYATDGFKIWNPSPTVIKNGRLKYGSYAGNGKWTYISAILSRRRY